MKLNLMDIINVPGGKKTVETSMDLSELEFYGERPIVSPVHFIGTVENKAGALFLSGKIITDLSLTCDRCLKDFTSEKVVTVEFLLADSLENEEDEDEIYLLEAGELDIDSLVSEQLIFAMDTKNLCSEDCKGLCDRCGANLNLGPCNCKPAVDPRLAALAQLLDDKN